jgi:hypothetical protein
MCDQELQQSTTKSSAEPQSRVLICAGTFVHRFQNSNANKTFHESGYGNVAALSQPGSMPSLRE